jgi:ketopantoate reductase
MMRIAIAGAGGFAYFLAQEITKGAYPVLILTRSVSLPTQLEKLFHC